MIRFLLLRLTPKWITGIKLDYVPSCYYSQFGFRHGSGIDLGWVVSIQDGEISIITIEREKVGILVVSSDIYEFVSL